MRQRVQWGERASKTKAWEVVGCSVGCYKNTCTIPYHTIQYHNLPYHTVTYHTIPPIPYHTIPYHTMLYHTIPYHTSMQCTGLVQKHLQRAGPKTLKQRGKGFDVFQLITLALLFKHTNDILIKTNIYFTIAGIVKKILYSISSQDQQSLTVSR